MTELSRLRLIIASLLFFCSGALACDEKPVYVESLADGRTFAIFMETAQVNQSPRWSDEGMPAMTWMAATKFLSRWASEKYKNYDDWKYYQISIRSFECAELSQHRFYLFHLVVTKDGVKTFGRQHFAAVLLDGTVVGPTEMK